MITPAITTVLVACGGHAFFAVALLSVAALTGSELLLAEAVQAIAMGVNLALLAIGLIRYRSKADGIERSSLGRQRDLHFWAHVAAPLIYSLAAGVALHAGVASLQHSRPSLEQGGGLDVLGGQLLFQAALLGFLLAERERRRVGEPEAATIAEDLTRRTLWRLGIAAMVGLLIGLAGSLMPRSPTWTHADAIATLMVALLLGGIAALAALETRRLIVGVSASSEFEDGFRSIVQREMGSGRPIADVGAIDVVLIGANETVATATLAFRNDATARSISSAIANIENLTKDRFPSITKLLIEIRRERPLPLERLADLPGGAIETPAGVATSLPAVAGASSTPYGVREADPAKQPTYMPAKHSKRKRG